MADTGMFGLDSGRDNRPAGESDGGAFYRGAHGLGISRR